MAKVVATLDLWEHIGKYIEGKYRERKKQPMFERIKEKSGGKLNVFLSYQVF